MPPKRKAVGQNLANKKPTKVLPTNSELVAEDKEDVGFSFVIYSNKKTKTGEKEKDSSNNLSKNPKNAESNLNFSSKFTKVNDKENGNIKEGNRLKNQEPRMIEKAVSITKMNEQVYDYQIPLAGSDDEGQKSGVSNKTGRRRSSFALRGKRQSAMGTSTVLPHSSINPKEFHKHVSPELPDPLRMRQLIVWTIQALMNKFIKDNPALEQPLLDMKENFIESVLNGEITTSWFQRPKMADVNKSIVRKPNPINEINMKLLQTYKEIEKRVNSEKDIWESYLDQLKNQKLELFDSFSSDPEILSLQKEMDNDLEISNTLMEKAIDLINVSPSMDSLYNITSQILQFENFANEYCEKLFKSIFKQFFNEDENQDPRKRGEILEILRALSKSEA